MPDRPPLPPFSRESATEKIRLAEDAWNSRDPERVITGLYGGQRVAETHDVRTALQKLGTIALTRKWNREIDYRLIKELYDSGHWFRSYGNENWEFGEHGLMRRRIASINDAPIAENDRKYRWPLGRRPDDHPWLSALGL